MPGTRRGDRRDGAPGAPSGLGEYHHKRNFAQTPEPRGTVGPAARAGDLAFVIQKHAATRLHYDFRLELDGVLKSWAVPKGPSLDPQDKRLAMHVEDHPLDYGGFEGIIPKGEYGGGTVLLWDRGTWRPEGDPHAGYRAGNLKFALAGEKLSGSWALVKIRGGRRDARDEDRAWLLIKHRDEHARAGKAGDVTGARPESVATGRTLEDIASASDRVWHSNRPAASAKAARSGSPRPPAPSAAAVAGGRRAALPRFVAPELATLVSKAPDGDGWLHEMKFDGYRILARLDGGRVQLLSRNERDWTEKFPQVADAVAGLPARTAMLDGEVAVLLPGGTTSFQALQNLGEAPEHGELVYMVFDLLHLDGYDLTDARLEDRKAALASLVAAGGRGGVVRYSDHVIGSGPDFFAQACRLGLEGAIAKRRDAPYVGTRGGDWLKIKCVREQEVVIGGYTDPEGARTGIGALLAGVNEDGRLVYVGKVGTGFTTQVLRDLKKRLAPLEQPTAPFDTRPTGVGRPHWVRPELVAQVTFSEWTSDGKMRHPSFQGLREDKPAAEVVRERAVAPAESRTTPSSRRSREKGPSTGTPPSRAKAPAVAERARSSRDGVVAEVAGVRLTHADRILFPGPAATKLDLARYYEGIAEWILPHLADRPTSLVRGPEGVSGTYFYQKHVGHWAPPSLRRVRIKEKTKVGEYLVVDTLAGLIALAQIDILEIHTWNSVTADLERPNRIVFDLDPAPDVEWSRVVEAARVVRARLTSLGLESWVKTTGGKGLHVVAPLAPGSTWDAGAEFSREVAEAIVREAPRGYVAHMAKAARAGKIFIDYLRNVRGATSVAAYSTRARPAAPVAVPLDWDELTPRLRSDRFTIESVPRRLASLRADPWRGYWTARQALPRPQRSGGA